MKRCNISPVWFWGYLCVGQKIFNGSLHCTVHAFGRLTQVEFALGSVSEKLGHPPGTWQEVQITCNLQVGLEGPSCFWKPWLLGFKASAVPSTCPRASCSALYDVSYVLEHSSETRPALPKRKDCIPLACARQAPFLSKVQIPKDRNHPIWVS